MATQVFDISKFLSDLGFPLTGKLRILFDDAAGTFTLQGVSAAGTVTSSTVLNSTGIVSNPIAAPELSAAPADPPIGGLVAWVNNLTAALQFISVTTGQGRQTYTIPHD